MGSQSKQACYADGGVVKVRSSRLPGVMPAIKGQPLNPITKAKRENGVPGFKAGGKVKSCDCK